MQACSRRIGEHVEHVELLAVSILCNLVGLLFYPSFLPFFLNLSEIVVHCVIVFLFFFCINITAAIIKDVCKDTLKCREIKAKG